MATKGPGSNSTTPKLSVVSDEVYQLGRKPETPTQRIRRLQDEAKLLAREQIEDLMREMVKLANKAEDIAKGGEAYPAGIRDLSGRVAEDMYGKIETYQALLGRIPLPNG